MYPYKTISQMFSEITDKYSSRKLYFHKKEDNWIGLTGSDIKTTVQDIAFGLRGLGIEEKSNIAIISRNSHKWAMSDYGIICSRMSTVTIYPTLIEKQVEYILQNSHTKLIFVENKEQLEKVNQIKNSCNSLEYIIVLDDSVENETEKILNFESLLSKGYSYSQNSKLSFNDLLSSISENDILTIIYTSGTTGVPKGVVLTHKNLISNVEATLKTADFNDNETFLSFLPLSHVLERMGGHYTGFSIGAITYYCSEIEKVAEYLMETHPTVTICVPRLFEKMYTKIIEGVKNAPKLRQKIFHWAIDVGKDYSNLKLAKEPIPFFLRFKHNISNKLVYKKVKQKLGGRIKFFVSGGAPLSAEIGEFFSAVNITILEGYGLTETSPVLSVNTEKDLRFGTVGKPLFNVDIKIEEDGEILAKGPNIMNGYFNDPDSTKEVFDKQGWFKTGDIGKFDNDGFLIITDRKKSLIVTSGGKNVAPAPLEAALINSSYIEQVMVIGDKRNFISALIVPAFESIDNYLKSKNIELSSNDAIIEHQTIIDLINEEVKNAMNNFSNFEKVKEISLLSKPFSLEKGEMTPKMSIVRKVVMENYKDQIESIYLK